MSAARNPSKDDTIKPTLRRLSSGMVESIRLKSTAKPASGVTMVAVPASVTARSFAIGEALYMSKRGNQVSTSSSCSSSFSLRSVFSIFNSAKCSSSSVIRSENLTAKVLESFPICSGFRSCASKSSSCIFETCFSNLPVLWRCLCSDCFDSFIALSNSLTYVRQIFSKTIPLSEQVCVTCRTTSFKPIERMGTKCSTVVDMSSSPAPLPGARSA
mmetsp:Transcript_38891/g.70820  ORF Transcript_38891/g.70820 Transcript_38891/m.70820 type:complete len:215 (-) Transcript_38891:49-693(-)